MSSHITDSNSAPCLNEDVTKHQKTETLTDSGVYTDSGDLDLRGCLRMDMPCVKTLLAAALEEPSFDGYRIFSAL